MDLRYAHAFYEAAKLLHFAKASAKLAIAPSALTRQIQLFEDSVGESLFVRSNRKVVLTQKGQQILAALQPLISSSDSKLIKLRIGGLAGVIDNHFWTIATPLLQSAEIQLSVNESTSAPALEGLLNGDLEMAFVNEKISNDLIQYFPLGKEELVLISKQRIQLKDLGKLPWVFCGRGSKLKTLSKVESARRIKVSSISKVTDLVELGVGVGIVPVSDKLSKRNIQITALPIKSRSTFLAVLKYKKAPGIVSLIISKIMDKT